MNILKNLAVFLGYVGFTASVVGIAMAITNSSPWFGMYILICLWLNAHNVADCQRMSEEGRW